VSTLEQDDRGKTEEDASASKPSTRQRLIAAAEQLFADNGWRAVSVRAIIAARADALRHIIPFLAAGFRSAPAPAPSVKPRKRQQ
jgi:hypothetical protein